MKIKYFFPILMLVPFFYSCSEDEGMITKDRAIGDSTRNLEQAKLAIYAMGLDTTFISEWGNYYVVEEDILVCKDSINLSTTRQYRTTYYVANSQVITIGVDNTISQSTNWREAVKEAISLYNEYTGITFRYSENNPDIKISKSYISKIDACASGVFPSSSRKPGNVIFINSNFFSNIDNYLTLNQKIFLLMHELGHNLGLRHTDCAVNGEGTGSSGMVKIPNTPDADSDSYMNSLTCGKNWNGMPYYDRMALRELWPRYCTLSFYGNKYSTSFREGDSVQVCWTHIPNTIPSGKAFAGWYYDYLLTNECIYGTYIKNSVTLYPKWRDPNELVELNEYSTDRSNGNKYMTLTQNSIVTVTCTVRRAFNDWVDIYRHRKETGGVITSYGHWPFVTINFWMEEYMFGPIAEEPQVTNTWRVFLPKGTYIYDAYFCKSLGTQNDGPFEKHGTTRVDISYYN